MRLRIVLLCVAVCLFAATVAMGQDAAKVDPKHYTVVSENAKVRILRIHYGPHEKSVMHSHPDSTAVYLSDGSIKFTMPDGKTQDASAKSGEAQFTPAMVHNPENTSDKPFDAILVELKGGGAGAHKPGAKPPMAKEKPPKQ